MKSNESGARPRIRVRRSRFDLLGRGLTLQLLLFVVLPLSLLLIAIAVGSLGLHQQAMRALVGQRDERAASASATAITELLNHRLAAIQGLALQPTGVISPSRLLEEYTFLLPDFDGGLAIFASDGALLAASNSPVAWQSRPVADLLNQTTDRVEPQFLAATLNSATGQFEMLVAAQRSDDGFAVGAFTPESLARHALTDTFSSTGQTTAFLVDQAGHVLFHLGPFASPTLLTQQPGVVQALRGESGTTYTTLEGSEQVVAFSPVARVNWALVIEEPWAAVDSPLLQTTQATPLVLIPVLIFTLVALVFGARQVVQPLRALEQKAADLTWGRYDTIESPVGGIGEVRRLQAELIDMAHKVKLAQQSLHSYVGAITAGQEDERHRLARELHDDTIQSLIALNQRLQRAQRSLADHPAAALLAETQQMVSEIIEEVRRFVRDLRPIYLEDLGLVPALEMLTRDTRAALNIPIEFSVSGGPRRLPAESELAVYRMTQEALSNIARHAGAGQAAVRLTFAAEALRLAIEDNGRGFVVPDSPAEFAALGHFGLLGLRERAELIGAQLAIHSMPGQGTTIEIRLPLS